MYLPIIQFYNVRLVPSKGIVGHVKIYETNEFHTEYIHSFRVIDWIYVGTWLLSAVLWTMAQIIHIHKLQWIRRVCVLYNYAVQS